MQEMKRHAQPWLRPRRAHGDCRRQRQDTDDLTQDAPSDQQYFLNAVAPSGRSIEPCVFRRNPKPHHGGYGPRAMYWVVIWSGGFL